MLTSDSQRLERAEEEHEADGDQNLYACDKGGDPPRINPLVDFYNAVSLRHVVPAGGFDLEEIDETLKLRLTCAGDAFHPLDGSAPEGVGRGEVAYASGAEILTRHFVYKHSRKALLDGSTTSLFFGVLALTCGVTRCTGAALLCAPGKQL